MIFALNFLYSNDVCMIKKYVFITHARKIRDFNRIHKYLQAIGINFTNCQKYIFKKSCKIHIIKSQNSARKRLNNEPLNNNPNIFNSRSVVINGNFSVNVLILSNILKSYRPCRLVSLGTPIFQIFF